ncbi:MAG: hypothetical protein ABJB65_00820 [Chloroflexota bacterium]
MTQAITESFCERCGTRYEFKAPTRLNAMRKTRGLVSGLRNYIMSQDALGDALDDGIRTEEEALAAHQLDAFHQSFNFCIDCRQYTCVSCWNDDAGRCRSCAPIAGTDDLVQRLAAATAHDATHAGEMAVADATVELGADAWPSADLVLAGANGNGHDAAWPAGELEPIAETIEQPPLAADEPLVAEAEPEPQPDLFNYEREAPEAEPFTYALEADLFPPPITAEQAAAADGPFETAPAVEPVAAAYEPPLQIHAWHEDLAAVHAEEPEPEPAPVVAEAEPEPVVAEAEPEPQPIPFDRRSYPSISETILPLRRPTLPPTFAHDEVAAEADSESLAARRAQLVSLGLDDPGQGAVERSRPNVLPYRSRGAAHGGPSDLGRRMAAHGGGSFWDASAREVAQAMSHVGVQNCGQCGLSLSASARFCRRCGTQQARSA